jgi:hypothetical protein
MSSVRWKYKFVTINMWGYVIYCQWMYGMLCWEDLNNMTGNPFMMVEGILDDDDDD